MKPILFSTTMVHAILEGRKTQTRRVIKPANPVKAARMGGYSQGNGLWIDGYTDAKEAKGSIKDYSISPCWQRLEYYMRDYAPYNTGDILWVREAWADGCMGGYIYKAGHAYAEYLHELKQWRSPIHMPRDAARIFLRVTDVRVERVQNISEAGARAEGIRSYWLTKEAGKGADDWHESNGPPFIGLAKEIGADLCPTRREAYRQLWDALNAKRGYLWESNPWVWVYDFERMEAPQ